MSLRRLGLTVAVACTVTAASGASSFAQTGDVGALSKKVVELYHAEKYAEALPLARQMLALREKVRGPEDPSVAPALDWVALLSNKQGRYDDAALLYKRALAIREKAFGPDHLDVAKSLTNLASTDTHLARYTDAEPLYKRALAIREKTLGPDHPDVLVSVNNLAVLYQNEDRYADAEPLYERALAMRETALGPDSLDVAASLRNLAAVYVNRGRYADAEPLYKRALAIREKALGPDSPDAAQVLNNLSALYTYQGRYADAESLYKRAVAIYEKALGSSPELAQSLSNLGALHHRQGRYADAESIDKRALAIREKLLGPDHPDVAMTLSNLALLYADQGRYSEAELLDKRALAIREKALGPDHRNLALSLNNLAALLVHQGRSDEAEPLYKRALAIYGKALGPDHPDIANPLNNLAGLYENQRRYAEAETLYRQALAIREKALGPDHPDVAVSLNNLAHVLYTQHLYAAAEPFYDRSLTIMERALGADHPSVGTSLNNLASLYLHQDRYADAERFYKRALTIKEKALGSDHPSIAVSLNNLAGFYRDQGRYADALPLVRTVIGNNAALKEVALPVLFGAQSDNLMTRAEASDAGLDVVQQAAQTAAGQALNALAVRFSAGSDRLAQLVRQDQDLIDEAETLDKTILEAASKEPAKRNAVAEQRVKDRSAEVAKQRGDLQSVFAKEFPDYAALSKPSPLKVKEIQALLAADEALVVVDLNTKSYVWAVTNSATDWQQLNVTASQVAKTVVTLRSQLDPDGRLRFDPQISFVLYSQVLGPVENIIRSKQRLSFVVNGALTSLPPQVLIASDPAGKTLNDVDWLIRDHAITILPSIASLKVLRAKTAIADAANPLIGFADPVFDRTSLAQNVKVAANVTAERGLRGKVADVSELALDLEALPESADELRRVAQSLHAEPSAVVLGADATETRVKQEKLDKYRIVYFATHGLVAGEVAEFAKLNAEPALVLSLPEKPTDFDDGLLTASEVAQLKLNADWVVLSACNTASGEKPGAEALSGLARAFFYAGGRSLLVSHWPVETNSAVRLMTGTFSAIAADPRLSHGEALRQAMLAMIDDKENPVFADPKYWAPFVVVGEPAKPAN